MHALLVLLIRLSPLLFAAVYAAQHIRNMVMWCICTGLESWYRSYTPIQWQTAGGCTLP